MTEYSLRDKCAICGNKELINIFNYGNAPLAGEFLLENQIGSEKLYPLNLIFCPQCFLLQTDSLINPDILFKDYRYMSSIGLSKRFEDMADYLVSNFKLNKESFVLDIGCNDGVLLTPLNKKGINTIGIDPAVNISQIARDKGCNVITSYFDESTAGIYFKENQFDLVVSTNSFAHIDDIHTIIRGVKKILKRDGVFVIEVHYVKNLLDQIQIDNCYAEHQYYYSLSALVNLFKLHNMTIVDCEEIPVHAGSIRIVVKNSPTQALPVVSSMLESELKSGLNTPRPFVDFSNKVEDRCKKIKDMLGSIKAEGKKIIGFGASGRANMLAHLVDLDDKIIQYIVDESPERAGRYLSSTHIPVKNKEYFDNDPIPPDYIFIFAWNFSKMIVEKLKDRNFKFIIPFPDPKIISTLDELELNTL